MTKLLLVACREHTAEGEVPFDVRHGSEKHVHRFPGLPETFGSDKAVNSVTF